MPVTIGDLLAVEEFGLTLVVPSGAPGPGASSGSDSGSADVARTTATEVAWVHSSDLPDPAPWLEPGQLLLSDGVQFAGDSSSEFALAYAARLADRGLVGLALSEGIVHDRIPDQVIAACAAAGLPLLRVPRRTPFIAVIRHVADILAQDRRERLEWSLASQRAVARAAASSGGLGSTISELERRLDSWVALYDAAGRPLPFGGVPARFRSRVDAIAQRAVSSPRPNRRHGLDGDEAVAIERIGQKSHPLGILAVGTRAPLDAAENDLVTSVLALAGIALEQRRALDLQRRLLRAGALELLLTGHPAAERVGAPLWGAVPDAPLRVAIVPGAADSDALLDALDAGPAEQDAWWFVGGRGSDAVVVADESGAAAVRALLTGLDLRAGISGAVERHSLDRGLTEAATALSSTRAGVADFDRLTATGLEGLLAVRGGGEVSRRMLAPLLEADAQRGPDAAPLVPTLRVWFENGCAWDRAARAIGVHRHTVRTRIGRAGALLGRDLDDPTDRAEVWLALRLVDVV